MTFYMQNYNSDEQYDISKFMDYQGDIYDVVASPFLTQLSQLPTVGYYKVDERFRDIDLIASDAYGDLFYAYLIQFYNNDFRESFPEGTVLNLFSADDLQSLYHTMSVSQNASNVGK